MINSGKNISGNLIQLSLSLVEERMSHIKIMNLLGQTVVSKWEKLVPGQNEISISIENLHKGTYRLIINVEEGLLKEDFFVIY